MKKQRLVIASLILIAALTLTLSGRVFSVAEAKPLLAVNSKTLTAGRAIATWPTGIPINERRPVVVFLPGWGGIGAVNASVSAQNTNLVNEGYVTLAIGFDSSAEWISDIEVKTLQGLNKTETAAKYGEKQVLVWRRSFNVAPHALSENDPRNPRFETRYRDVADSELPRTESLEDTIDRILPYWKSVIFPQLEVSNELLVVAHGNSLRGIIKYLKHISDENIVSLNLPTAVPYVFEFDNELKLTNDYFLGDPEEIRKLTEAVANQAKAV